MLIPTASQANLLSAELSEAGRFRPALDPHAPAVQVQAFADRDPQFAPATAKSWGDPRPCPPPEPFTRERVLEVVSALFSLDSDCPYAEWRDCLVALRATGWGNKGLLLADLWSAIHFVNGQPVHCLRYAGSAAVRQLWTAAQPDGSTLKMLFAKAAARGWHWPQADARAVAMVNQLGWQLPSWQEQLLRRQDQRLKEVPANYELILRHDPRWREVIGYDEFSHRLVKLKAPPYAPGTPGQWEEFDTVSTRIWFNRHYDLDPASATLEPVVRVVAQHHPFNAVKEHLLSLHWDGVPRLESWLSVLGDAADCPYTRLVARRFLLGAVARAFTPGVKFDHVLLLEGAPGTEKSRFLRALALRDEWFIELNSELGSRRAYEAMIGKWFVELPALDHFSRTAQSFFSAQYDTTRLAYRRGPRDYPRRCVFVGTVTPSGFGYLKNSTGHRRFWPIAIAHLDTAALLAIRELLWAEAVAAYLAGERYWVTAAEQPRCEAAQTARLAVDPYVEPLLGILRVTTFPRLTVNGQDREFVATAALAEKLGDKSPLGYSRIAKAMAYLHGEPYRPGSGSRQTKTRGYLLDRERLPLLTDGIVFDHAGSR